MRAAIKPGKQSAVFSSCGRYRYGLSRVWDERKPVLLFIMLNPSTADAEQDDPTIRRCIAFAKSWGYGGLLAGNLFGLRATDPSLLYENSDVVGEENDKHLIQMAALCKRVVFAWGNHGILHERGIAVKSLFPKAWCIGKNKNGQPRHPLYLSADSKLIRF